jgi:hypothetical protein
MTLVDEVLQILRESIVPMSRKEIFERANEAGNADDVSRALYHLNKSGKIKRLSADNGGYQWAIPIGEQLKAALKPKHTPAPKPILPPSATTPQFDPPGNLRYSINDDGELTVYINDGMSDPLTFSIHETLALGDFMHATTAIWRP